MRNRWNLELSRGASVSYSLARGGHAESTIAGFYRMSGYGWQCRLANGASCSIDDIGAVTPIAKRAKPLPVLTLRQWETRIADIYSSAASFKSTHAELMERTKVCVHEELNRKHGKRAVYPAFVQGFVRGLITVHNEALYRYHFEFCYVKDGVLFSTHRGSAHRSTEEFYSAGKGSELGRLPNGHFWKGTDRPFSVGVQSCVN